VDSCFDLTSCVSPATKTPLTASHTIHHFDHSVCYRRRYSPYHSVHLVRRTLFARAPRPTPPAAPNHRHCRDVCSRARTSSTTSLHFTTPSPAEGEAPLPSLSLIALLQARPPHASTIFRTHELHSSLAIAPQTLSQPPTLARTLFTLTAIPHCHFTGRAGSRPTPALISHLTRPLSLKTTRARRHFF
jgi:hypothetical protein